MTSVKQEMMPYQQSVTTHEAANQPVDRLHEPRKALEVAATGSGELNRRTTMNMMVKATAMKPANLARKAAVVPNKDRPTLADLIGNLIATHAAAEAGCTLQGEAEKKFKFGRNLPRPKVLGGMTEPMMLKKGDAVTEYPASEWFYSSREEIEKSGGERTAELLAEWDRQEKACKRAYPKELRAAERAAIKALDAWTRAEQALVRYRPTCTTEALELLILAGRPSGRGLAPYLEICEDDYRTLVNNCAAVLQKELAH